MNQNDKKIMAAEASICRSDINNGNIGSDSITSVTDVDTIFDTTVANTTLCTEGPDPGKVKHCGGGFRGSRILA